MQIELAGTGISILGVNQMGSDTWNSVACADRDIPWLQDNNVDRVWELWDVTYRDVLILGPDNEVVGVYNLTGNDLADPVKYAALKAMLVLAAAALP